MIESGSISLLKPDRSIQVLRGEDLPKGALAILPELSGERAAARKFGQGLLVSTPVGKAGWMIWLLEAMPDNIGLSELLTTIQKQSLQMIAKLSVPTEGTSNSALKDMLDVVALAALAPRKNRIALLLSDLLTNGAYGQPIVAKVSRGRARKLWYSNQTHGESVDELKQFISAQAKSASGVAVFHANATDKGTLDGALLCQRLGVETLALQFSTDPKNGYVFVSTSPKMTSEKVLASVPELIDLVMRAGRAKAARRFGWRPVLAWSALVALVVFLAYPVTLKISSTGQSVPASATTVALPTGAYLEETFVRPGQFVEVDTVLATFRSLELEEQKAEEEFNRMLEQINAQDALAQGRYAEFQLAEQRGNIAVLRLEQLTRKIEYLTVKSPVSGRVIDTLSAGMRGRFIQAGMSVAEIQDTPKFDMLIEVAGLDAPLIQKGQGGQVYFRGLSDEIYQIEIVSKPVLRMDEASGVSHLEVRAKITDGDQDKLLVGLSGFVKVEVGQEPNVVALTRYAVEYVRLFAWKYLGLRV